MGPVLSGGLHGGERAFGMPSAEQPLDVGEVERDQTRSIEQPPEPLERLCQQFIGELVQLMGMGPVVVHPADPLVGDRQDGVGGDPEPFERFLRVQDAPPPIV